MFASEVATNHGLLYSDVKKWLLSLPKSKDFKPVEGGEGVFSTFCYKCAIS